MNLMNGKRRLNNMIKKSIYPKTKRYEIKNQIQITEKIDGSNLTIFKKNNELYVATRNYIFKEDELEQMDFKGFKSWFEKHKEEIRSRLLEGRAICGEWLGMGKIAYGEIFDNKYLMFAKAIINDDFELDKINYEIKNLEYAFEQKEDSTNFPSCIGVVPVVENNFKNYPSIEDLDGLYEEYRYLEDRNIEGFIILYRDTIRKYVRMKNGKLKEHTEKGGSKYDNIKKWSITKRCV